MTKLLDAEVVLACQPSRPFEYTIGQVAVTEDGRVVFAKGYQIGYSPGSVYEQLE